MLRDYHNQFNEPTYYSIFVARTLALSLPLPARRGPPPPLSPRVPQLPHSAVL